MFFNADEHEPVDFSPLPPGKYPAEIIDTAIKPTQKGGERLEIRFRVTSGNHAGRTVYANINTVCASAQAQAIGQGELSRLCRCIGRRQLATHEALIGGRVEIRVAIEAASGVTPERNRVAGYDPLPQAPAGGTNAVQPNQVVVGSGASDGRPSWAG